MHPLRLSLLSLATVLSVAVPVAASAAECGAMMDPNAVMMTPLSARGRFVFTTRISRRMLRQAVAERQQRSAQFVDPLLREIL
jgi:hypothetical protein